MSTNVFLEDWKQTMLQRFRTMCPQFTDEQILEILEEDIKENFKDPNSTIHNDYNDDMLLQQPLSMIYRFAKEKKPILAGNGTLFYNQDKAKSPVADIIDDRIDTRAMYKGKMKNILGQMADVDPRTPEWNKLNEDLEYADMMQMEAKVRINSIYGSFGAPTFQLYNKYTAASTTGTAQSLISATAISFEAFIGNNVKFKSMDECVAYIDNIIREEYEIPFDGIITDGVSYDPDTLYDILVRNFADGVYQDSWDEILYGFLKTTPKINLVKLYYKNNLLEAIKCPAIENILVDIFSKLTEFNDPNKVPDIIKPDIQMLWDYFAEFVFYNYAYTERINRLKNDERDIVKLVDTDSNLVYVQMWVDEIINHIIPQTNTAMDIQGIKFAAVNTLAYLVTQMLKELLGKYCTDAHVLERYHHRINMKNEFCFDPLLLAPTKKRYIGRMLLREGKRVDKVEIKGHDFKKAAVTEFVRDSMEKIIHDRITSVSPQVDIPGIMSDLDKLERQITESLNNGERTYLMRMNCKQEVAYKNPYSMPQVLSVMTWNAIYPEREIMLPDKLDVVYINIPNVATLEKIRTTYPYEYNRIKTVLFEGSMDLFREKGIRYLAIPNNEPGIPDFIKPFIDYEYVKSRNINTFKPIVDALGNVDVGTKQNSHFSNIRRMSKIEI